MDSDDHDLQRAIQLSLQTGQDETRSRRVDVDLTTDEGIEIWPGFENLDDMDFWKGIALSMGEGAQLFNHC